MTGTEQPTEKRNYVEKEDLLRELRLSNKNGEISEELHVMFFEIARNYAHIKSFRNYSFIDDMIVEGYINCILVAHKYDTEAGTSPFSYFTTTIHRNFLKFIARESKQQKRKWKELKVIYEKYMIENNIKLKLPDNILEKMYEEEEKKPKVIKEIPDESLIEDDIYKEKD